jgi:hypothetical protein
MDRAFADLALQAMSLGMAMMAISFWRRLPEPSPDPKAVDHGVLRLDGTQLLATTLEGSELVIDAFGGSGNWVGYGGTEVLEEGQVAGTPMLTFRASFDHAIDLTALERLLAWTDAECHVDMVVEVQGDSPLKTPTRITITDHARAVSLMAPVG